MSQNGHKPNYLVNSLINANVAVKIHDIISLRCRLAFVVTLIISELIFYAIYRMDLEFVSTMIFFIIVFYLLRLFWSIFGAYLNPVLFPEIPDEDERDIYVSQSLKSLNQIIFLIYDQFQRFISYLNSILCNPSLKVELCFFCVLIALFIFFSIIGTFWFCFIVYHLCLFLTKILQLQIAQSYIDQSEEESDQQKIKTN